VVTVEMANGDGLDADLRTIGIIESALKRREDCPSQPDEKAPPAVLRLEDWAAPALVGLSPGDEIIVITWLDRANRDTLTTEPRNDPARPTVGVFATRSPDRPNPIGLHPTTVTKVQANEIHLAHLETLDGTPVLDIKPVLGPISDR
jgi:tRNA-Thr(GGU) m(6)t(6)A37 methyltransferase TsaA